MRALPAGTSAVLIELDSLEQVMGLSAALRSTPPVGTVDLVPPARTVLVIFDGAATTVERVVADVSGRQIDRVAEPAGPAVELPVRYDGADLAEVAGLSGLSAEEVVARHLRPEYRVAFCGFAPGFAYLVGGDPALRVPRRSSPRHCRAGRIGGAGRRVHRRLSAPYARRLATHRSHRRGAVGPESGPTRVAATGTRVRFVEKRP